jgi:hypothetical protein
MRELQLGITFSIAQAALVSAVQAQVQCSQAAGQADTL